MLRTHYPLASRTCVKCLRCKMAQSLAKLPSRRWVDCLQPHSAMITLRTASVLGIGHKSFVKREGFHGLLVVHQRWWTDAAGRV
jgi:hypothetical protein